MMKSLQKAGVALVATVVVMSTPAALGFSPLSPTHFGPRQQQSTLLRNPVLSWPPPSFPKQSRLATRNSNDDNSSSASTSTSSSKRQKILNFVTRVTNRLDTLETAGITNSKQAGLFGLVKKAHDPITYLGLLAVAGFRMSWCFKSIYYWFVVGFCVKWYRARYVFKIPVWDRQPNWNNVITNKEQEKDLKAFTCKKCGSTIFIAKTREFFFEGSTGIGGLGCFSCGAKGADNFVMDRDRIVEEVGEDDDYFDYERPLDFVSRAERRKLMKEAKGDEELANQLLMERTNPNAASAESSAEEEAVVEEAPVVEEETEEEVVQEEAASIEEEETESDAETAVDEEEPEVSDSVEPTAAAEEAPPAPQKKKPATKKAPEPAAATDDDFDILGLD